MSIYIKDNTFADACFSMNSIADLRDALDEPADETDMREWGLTPREWRENIALALAARLEQEREEN